MNANLHTGVCLHEFLLLHLSFSLNLSPQERNISETMQPIHITLSKSSLIRPGQRESVQVLFNIFQGLDGTFKLSTTACCTF